MGKLSVIVGGQYGSEGKGAFCAHLVRRNREKGTNSCVVRVAGPNAGHTAYDDSGRAWPLRTVPVGLVADPRAIGVIADGSEVDLPVLLREVRELDEAGLEVSKRLYVSGCVTMLTSEHHATEGPEHADLHTKIGSTGKGIGAARAARVMRTATTPDMIHQHSTMAEFLAQEYSPDPEDAAVLDRIQFIHGSTVDIIESSFACGSHVMIEGTQGYGLGLHRPEYPRVTSSDTRAIDFLAMAGVNPWASYVDKNGFDVWVVVRAFPIRVAGDSGPLFKETTWGDLNLPVELTTVTRKPRRVGLWDDKLFSAAVQANGVDVVKVAYTMADQECSEIAGFHGPLDKGWGPLSEKQQPLPAAAWREIELIQRRTYWKTQYIGTGPNTAIWMDTL